MDRMSTSLTEAKVAARTGPAEVAAWCALVALLDGFDTQAIAYVAPVLAEAWRVPAASFGLVFAAGLLGLTVGTLFVGPYADKVGRRPVIIASTLVFGGFALATAYANSVPQLLALRFLTGIGLGGAMPNLIALTSEVSSPATRARMVTIMFSGYPLGAVVGGVVSAALIGKYGWQVVFYLGGGLPLLIGLGLLLRLPESPSFGASTAAPAHAPVEAARSVVELFGVEFRRTTLLVWLAYFCTLLVIFTMTAWLPTLLKQKGMSVSVAIVTTALLNLGGVFGGALLSVATRRFHALSLIALSYAAAVGGIVVVASGDSAQLLMIATFLTGAGLVGSQLLMNGVVTELYPTRIRVTAVGWALGVGRVGTVAGPLIGGFFLSRGWGYLAMVAWMAVPAAVAAIAVLSLRRLKARTTGAH
ncbi:major facilitator superfamily MFS_1 (plasmid) [Cupriavidus necator N-1]|uniref:Major facilitator superfamily MFS_1 n=1 Tax=Cupriavidus necator (strain ATCC 43291 / DSM 13513 / CCUG 52238 / LMG 8453 / N-1) TaxID=1042878 RepID=F8GVR1_CUPNN|nr:aromatic acid/H+ symport family MFS transporter [Cupriavidus necator]AEI82681.1 major facilitator superfamily MFS_1 [Cupriavidus necator N-1]MDX6007675.1 aromatic acid/H+ symport family MFS transporter [Cupriavidus necator]